MTKDGTSKPRKMELRRRQLLFLSIITVAAIFAFFQTAVVEPPILMPTLHETVEKPVSVSGLKCIRVMRHMQTREGIGAFFKLNQLAVLLASYYNADIAFPSIVSVHDYNFGDLFGKCGPPDDKDFPSKCVLTQADLNLKVCPRADCRCMAGQVAPDLQRIVDRGCPIVGVLNDGYKRQEFSGCLTILNRYFAAKGPPPAWQYDAIHYRMGDLAHTVGGKKFTDMELWLLIKWLCKLSDRDIVVVTEGSPEVPECGNRIVLADTSIQHSMQIFQYARHVSVGVSSFAHILMEFAKPERMVMKLFNARRFEWVDCEKWTLINTLDGATFHFSNKAQMLETIISTRDLMMEWKGRKRSDLSQEVYNTSVPKRRWTPEMMKPAILWT